MLDLAIPLAFGGSILTLSVLLIGSHWRSWRGLTAQTDLERGEREYSQRQFRRRMQSSMMLAGLGLLLMLATERIPWQRMPLLFAVYVASMLGLLVWVVFLALADALATRQHTRAAQNRLQTQRVVLEAELQRLRQQEQDGLSNGTR